MRTPAAIAALALLGGCLTDPATYGVGGDGGARSMSSDVSAGASTGNGPMHPSVRWARSISSESRKSLNALAVDEATGATYVAGSWDDAFEGEWPGSVLGVCQGTHHAFIGRIEADGSPSWGDCFGADASVRAIDLDGAGNITLAGDFRGMIVWNGQPHSAVARDAFVARYAEPAAGRAERAAFVQIGGEGDDSARGIATTDQGGWVVGVFEQSITIASKVLSATAGADVFVARLSTQTIPLDAQAFADAGLAPEVHVGLHAGTLYLGGAFEGSMQFGAPAPSLAATGSDAFLATLDAATLAPITAASHGGGEYDAIHAIDTGGELIAVAGEFAEEMALTSDGSMKLVSADAPDAFSALLDTADLGHVLRTDQLSALESQVGLAAATRGAHAAAAGWFVGAPSGLGTASDGVDAFVLRFEESRLLWSFGFGGPGAQIATSVDRAQSFTVVGGTHTDAFQVRGVSIGYEGNGSTTDMFVIALDD